MPHPSRAPPRRARTRLPRGVDLAWPMVTRTRAGADEEGMANCDPIQAAAQAHPLGGAESDVAVSRYGILFFTNSVAVLANFGRAPRPGGRLVFLCPGAFERMDQFAIFRAADET
ncbi:class I SAM-dependent methyltransferase [Streptomyces sp. NPDC020681]|uniref:class I SAM-dependent methyltransferase n=1 Tax=Streptomyces sp. NPDC020681 TaxID=3365083 RepID=UPI0037A4116A